MRSADGLELWLVRHGQTPRSRDGRLAGWVDTPLTPLGVEQARAVRSQLAGRAFTGVWSSDLRRAVRTARLAWGEPRRDRRLREISFGRLEGARLARLEPHAKRALLDFDGFRAPGGESLDDVRRRVMAFLDELHAGCNLVFTHGGVVRMLTREVGYDAFLPTGSLAVVDWTERRLLSVTTPQAP